MKRLNKFIRDVRGNVAMMTAISLPVLFTLVGGGIDYSRKLVAETKLQTVTDSAVLAAMAYINENGADDRQRVQAVYEEYFTINADKKLDHMDVEIEDNQLIIREDDGIYTLQAKVSARMDTHFLDFIGLDHFDLQVASETKRGNLSLEVVLVLDNSGSMDPNVNDYGTDRIGKLKDAAEELVDTLSQYARREGMVKIGIVPFTQFVNVGVENADKPWLNIGQQLGDKTDGVFIFNGASEGPGWMKENGTYYACSYITKSTSYSSRWPWWWNTSYTDSGEEEYTCKGWKEPWNGAVGIRQEDLDISDADFGSKPVPAVIDYAYHYTNQIIGPYPIAPILPLQDVHTDKSRILQGIDRMRAKGGTYIPAGLVWGWRVLSSDAPFTEADPADEANIKGTRKVIIMMTDGYNTSYKDYQLENYFTALRSGTVHQPETDDTLRRLCNKIKNEGADGTQVEIITITLDLAKGDEASDQEKAIKEVFKECATKDSYDIDNHQLESVFRSIAERLLPLHLSK